MEHPAEKNRDPDEDQGPLEPNALPPPASAFSGTHLSGRHAAGGPSQDDARLRIGDPLVAHERSLPSLAAAARRLPTARLRPLPPELSTRSPLSGVTGGATSAR